VDPLEALQGALLPFGGYKGGALSLAVELLGGVLAGGTPPGGDKVSEWGIRCNVG